uniref:U3 small nucleolar RNA-associated protein 6 homolog n=1 Tax=Meloidogyne floridensis TaxID=298350 RepID=A0A915NS24_9BILA
MSDLANSNQKTPKLSSLALRKIILTMVTAKLRWRRIEEFREECREYIIKWNKINEVIRLQILDGLDEAIFELKRWTEKHTQIFPEEENLAIRKAALRQKAQSLDCSKTNTTSLYKPQRTAMRILEKSDYLRIFYDCLIWEKTMIKINDFATAKNIVESQCKNWSQLKFQFACCYAMEELLEDERIFDKNRRRAFKKKLDNHPIYHFWLRVLADRQEWTKLYRSDRLIVDQRLMLAFKFAINNGFLELVKRLWDGLSEGQMEAIGFLCWKKVCFNLQHPEMVRFLCTVLCRINKRGMAQMSWNNFYHKTYQTLDVEGLSRDEKLERFKKLECLLENWCDPLRKIILSRENFRVFTDSVYYNRPDSFLLFLDYLEDSKHLINGARKEVDRIYERKKDKKNVQFFRQQLIRRQTANE